MAVGRLKTYGALLLDLRFGEADRYGGFVVGLIVISAGVRVAYDTAMQLIDTMPEDRLMKQIRAAALAETGVRGVEKCFARKTGMRYHVDLHLEVDPAMTVRQSHELAHRVQQRVLTTLDWVAGVLVLNGDEGLAVAVTTHEGLSQVDPREANAEGAVAAFRFLSPPPPLTITALSLEADLRVQLHQFVRLAVDETRIDVIAELVVRRAGVFALVAPLPVGWELVDASGLAIDDSRVSGDGATRKLELALRARLLGDAPRWRGCGAVS